MNRATFYNKLHSEYTALLLDLIKYYKDNATATQPGCINLHYFVSEQINIPNIQLNLKPIFVNVTEISTCKRLINLTLQLLAETLPTNTMNMDFMYKDYEHLFQNVLHILEHFDVELKLYSIQFYAVLINKFDQVSVMRFCNKFPNVIKDLMNCIESLIASIETYYEKSDIDKTYLEEINGALLLLFKGTESFTYKVCKQNLVNISTIIFKTDNMFNKELKYYFLGKKLNLPDSIITLQNMNAAEIHIISSRYIENILDYINNLQVFINEDTLKQNFFYHQVLITILSLETRENINIDIFILKHHLERCSSALNILKRIHIDCTKQHQQNVQIFTQESANLVINKLTAIYDKHTSIIISSKEIVKIIMDIVLSIVLLHDTNKQLEGFILNICSLQTMDGSMDVKLTILEYLLLESAVLKYQCSNVWNNNILVFFNSVLNNKSNHYKQVSLHTEAMYIFLQLNSTSHRLSLDPIDLI